MPKLRSATSTQGRNMAGARALWRATGMKENDFGKPIIAVVNSFTQFVPGHVHLKDMGQLVAAEIEKITAELIYTQGFLKSVQNKLSNEKFVNGAPEKVLANERQKEADALAKIATLEQSLAGLK